MSGYLIISVLVYGFLISIIIWLLLSARSWALANLATQRSVEQWQSWREDVAKQQAQPGPVQRRVPKSTEPPALVMMRDYFSVSLIGAVLFTSVLYWVIAWFVAGIAHHGDNSRVA